MARLASSEGFLEKCILFSPSHRCCFWVMNVAGALILAEVGYRAMQQVDELTLGVIPLGSEISPGVNFYPLCLWKHPGLVVLVRDAGRLVMVPGWREHSSMANGASWLGCWAAGAGGGRLFPRAVVHSHVRFVEWELPGWTCSQGAGKWSMPGTRTIFSVKERAIWTPCDGGYCLSPFDLSNLDVSLPVLVARAGREWIMPPNLTGI